jgi:hypothetical protein
MVAVINGECMDAVKHGIANVYTYTNSGGAEFVRLQNVTRHGQLSHMLGAARQQ